MILLLLFASTVLVKADELDYEELNFELANAIREDKHNESLRICKQLLEITQDDSSVWFQYAKALQSLGNETEALAAYDKTIALDPTDVDAYHEAGMMLQHSRKEMEAIPYWQEVIRLEPENAFAHYSMGNVLHATGHDNDSVVSHMKAIELNPTFFEAYNNLGTTYMSLRDYSEAITWLHRALVLIPTHPIPIMNVLFVQRKVADWRWYEEHLAWFSVTFSQQLAKDIKMLDPWMASTFKLSPMQLRGLHELLAKQINDIVHGYRYPRSFEPAAMTEGERFRVGYVSSTGFQGNYTTAKFMRSIFGLHDPSKVQVHCFARGDDDHTPERAQIKDGCEVWWDAGHWPLSRISDTVNHQRLHALIDLSGWTIFPGTEVFAMQPAPLQLQLHGFPGTMGADYFQYMATDVLSSPPEYQSHYHEKLMFSPSTYLCNDFKQSRREALLEWGTRRVNASNGVELVWPTRQEFGFEEDDVIFAAFNSLYKLDRETVDTWLQVMQKLPKTKLWMLLFDDVSPGNLAKMAESYGVNSSRLVFHQFFNRDREMHIKALADVFVDTPAFTAHTTGGDTLWAGLPIITLPGEDFAARVCAALCKASEVPETIVRNMRDYRNLMYKLGKNKLARTALRKKLLEKRENSPHFDTEEWVREFEAQLLGAWDVMVADRPPMMILAANRREVFA